VLIIYLLECPILQILCQALPFPAVKSPQTEKVKMLAAHMLVKLGQTTGPGQVGPGEAI